jgi:hypothetical protein
MPELVRVDHGPDRLDQAVGDVQRDYAEHAALCVVGDRARLAVDPGQLRPGKRGEQRLALAATIADHDHVGREHLEQPGQVAAARGGEEPAGHLVALRS